MGQIPHTLFDYNVTTLNGESRPYSRYENYLSKRFVKVTRNMKDLGQSCMVTFQALFMEIINMVNVLII